MKRTVSYAFAGLGVRPTSEQSPSKASLRLRGDRGRSAQPVDGRVRPAIERVDPGQPDEGREIVAAQLERFGEPAGLRPASPARRAYSPTAYA